jgi:sulfonate transport system permease protein
MRPGAGHAGRAWRGTVLPVAALAGWMLLSRSRTYSYAFVPVGEIAHAFVELTASGDLLRGLFASLTKAIVALLLGAPAGIALGASMGASRWVDRALGPVFHVVRQVPYLGLAPLIGLWFGGGDVAKIILVFLAVLFPMALSTYEGVKNVEPRLVEVARVLRLDRRQVFLKVTLPSVLPYAYTGLSQAITFAWIATVGSEMLLHAGQGVGTLLQAAEAGGRIDSVMVCVFSVTAASVAIDLLLIRLGQRTMRWQRGT